MTPINNINNLLLVIKLCPQKQYSTSHKNNDDNHIYCDFDINNLYDATIPFHNIMINKILIGMPNAENISKNKLCTCQPL
jgi:hypothetical protein